MTIFFTPLPNRGLLKVSGPEASSFLQGLVTSDLELLSIGQSGFTTLLTPQGKILFEFFIIPNKEGYLLDCLGEAKEALHKRLKLYKLRANVSLEDVTQTYNVTAIFSDPLASPVGLKHSHLYADPRLKNLGFRIYSEQNTQMDFAKESKFSMATLGDYQKHCLNLGVPALGNPELGHGFSSEDVFLLDVNYDLLNAVSYQKGCFVGQEVTSRMKRKGEVRRRTLLVTKTSDHETQFTTGDEVYRDEAKIGKLLAVQGNSALALIRMDRLGDQERASVQIGTADAIITYPSYMKPS